MEIIFTADSKEVELLTENPIPAKKSVPEWYKKSPTFNEDEYKNTVLKQCLPFLDATTCGYVQKTWSDIYIGVKENKVFIDTGAGPEIVSVREKANVPVGDFYYPIEFVWHKQWTAKLPKGYSLLITQPHNRLDLPFTTLSGVVDSDVFFHTPRGNIPFYVRKGFNGFIPVGTPMYQMLPFKRDNWDTKIEQCDEAEVLKRNTLMRRRFFNAYRDMFWQKKHYN